MSRGNGASAGMGGVHILSRSSGITAFRMIRSRSVAAGDAMPASCGDCGAESRRDRFVENLSTISRDLDGCSSRISVSAAGATAADFVRGHTLTKTTAVPAPTPAVGSFSVGQAARPAAYLGGRGNDGIDGCGAGNRCRMRRSASSRASADQLRPGLDRAPPYLRASA